MDMDNDFVRGLSQLKKADPQRTVETLFRLFASIGTMKSYEVMAAKQTLDLFEAVTLLDDSTKTHIVAFLNALLNRAKILLEEARETEHWYVEYERLGEFTRIVYFLPLQK